MPTISAAWSTTTPTTIKSRTPPSAFPIAFRKSIIYGAEAKLDVPDWRGFSGFLSYSYHVGNAWFPVTGGFFLGDDAEDSRPLAISRIRRINATPFGAACATRLRRACGSRAAFSTTPDCLSNFNAPMANQAVHRGRRAQYGQQVVDRINFDRGRILPAFQVNASAGALLYKSERMQTRSFKPTART